ncbi:hypothetical protein POUND7_012548 [Theobroma cacao]
MGSNDHLIGSLIFFCRFSFPVFKLSLSLCLEAVARAVVGDKEHTFVPCRYFHGHGNWILIGRCQSFINSRASSQLMMNSRIPSGHFSLYNAASKFYLYKP